MSAKGDTSEDQRSQKSETGSEGGKTPRSQAGSRAQSHAGSHTESRGKSSQGGQTPRGRNSRVNKIYRAPPTPPPEEQGTLEKGFVLDCKAVSSISTDYSRANPKLGPVIPPYNSQKDKHVTQYYTFIGVDKTLKRTGQTPPGTSSNGYVFDRFHRGGSGWYYLKHRNFFGAGHSNEDVDGHAQFMQGVKPAMGYNGKYGYRRNTPWLRTMPSPFGTASTSPTH